MTGIGSPSSGLGELWAKGAPARPGDPYHPLFHHLVDVAGVACAMWHIVLPAALREWFGNRLGVDGGAAGRQARFLAASHHVGKACPAIQDRQPRTSSYATVSAAALQAWLAATPWSLERDLARRLAVVVGAHHGVAPRHQALLWTRRPPSVLGGAPWTERHDGLLRQCADICGIALGSPGPA